MHLVKQNFAYETLAYLRYAHFRYIGKSVLALFFCFGSLATVKRQKGIIVEMLVLNGAGFLVILLSGLRQTPQSEDTNLFRAFLCAYLSQTKIGTTE